MGSEKLFISWQELEKLTKKLVKKIKESDFEPNALVGISRGGLPICVRVSHLLDLPMGVIEANHYRGDGYGTKINEAKVEGKLLSEDIKDTILIVDDIIDTGETMKVVKDKLKSMENINEVKSGVLHEKPNSVISPDFCAYPSPTTKWVVYPFEEKITR